MLENRSRFDNAAKDWDMSDFRLSLAKNITQAILDHVPLRSDQNVLDFGCGTGLVGLNIAPFVKHLLGADISKGMLEAFCAKASAEGLTNTSALQLDVDSDFSHLSVDLVVSAMALHHIKDPHRVFAHFSAVLPSGGTIAIADLAKEDGNFHADNTGVYHFGFAPDEWQSLCRAHGFEAPSLYKAHTIPKNGQEYEIVLCVAKKI